MTIAFWVLAANLIIIALLIIIVPIWLRRDVKLDDNDQHNLDIGRQKLIELKSQREQQKISQAEYEEQLTELELALDDELSQVQESNTTVNQGRWIIAIIIPLLPVAAITSYLALGAPQMLNAPQPAQPTEVAASSTSTQADIKTMLVKLVERLQQNPDDVKGWLMLGRTYMYLNSYSDAADAFAQANQLQPDEVNILIQYADALAMSSGGRMAGKPNEMVFKALTMDPEHTTGLWLAGMAKAEQGDYQAALEYWLKVEPLITNDAESTIQLQKLIADARAKSGQQAVVIKPEQAASSVTSPVTVAPLLTVQVELTAELKAQTTPTDTVFIYAQALQGMRIPLAIVRKQVKDLPITVSLSDAEAMSPMAKLSNHKQVKILARISKTGDAMSQPGDLIGSVTPVIVNSSETVQVVISEMIN